MSPRVPIGLLCGVFAIACATSAARADDLSAASEGSNAKDRPSVAITPALASPTNPPDDPSGVFLAMDFTRSTVNDSFAQLGASTWGVRESMHGRASRRIAFDLGVEQAYGNTSSGYRHYDLGFALPEVYFYLTPDARLQLYTLTGFQLRFSHFETASADADSTHVPGVNFFMGAVLGAGVEIRVADKTALRFELRGFLRGRVDSARENVQLAATNDTNHGVSLGVGVVFF